MIQKFIDIYMARRGEIEVKFLQKHPEDYKEIVSIVVEILQDESEYAPDPTKIHVIDDGDYQGTLVFVIGSQGYQPYWYWYVIVDYGSCSGCDTLEGISRGYEDKSPNEEQIKEYMDLTLHIVQGLKEMRRI
jgi:hypothetical protein